MALASKDRGHLEKLKSDLSYSGPIREKLATTPSGRNVPFSFLVVWSKDMVRDLGRNFNITERKTLTLAPPYRLSEPSSGAFIAGLIDGGGSIHTYNYGRQSTLRLDVMGTLPVVSWVGEYFQRWCGPKKRWPRIRELYGGTVCSLRLQGRNAERVAERLLEIDVPKLQRKWSIARGLVRDRC